jgi:hypothetical protein
MFCFKFVYKMFDTGFGGKLSHDGPTQHCFDMSANESGEVQVRAH